MPPVLRLLTADDLEDALSLSSTAGWNQQLADWQLLRSIAPAGSFCAVHDGRIVATAIGIDYGGFGWIAMMLVEPSWRGQGLGRQLLDAAIRAIPADRPVRLDATPMGRPLYQSFGFEDESRLSRWVAAAFAPGSADGGLPAVRPLSASDVGEVARQDQATFGGAREPVLRWAQSRAPQYAWVVEDDGAARQYCFGRQGRRFDQVGPVVAADERAARALVAAAAANAGGRAVVVDAFDDRQAFTAWLAGCGFVVERPLFRMCRPGRSGGFRDGAGVPEYAIFGPEFG